MLPSQVLFFWFVILQSQLSELLNFDLRVTKMLNFDPQVTNHWEEFIQSLIL